MMTRCRLYRSATMPPNGAVRKTGIWLANPTEPSNSEDPVSRYTSQASAMLCIHVPMSEMSCPLKKSWKLRWRRARNVVVKLRFRSCALGGAASSFCRGEESTFARTYDAGGGVTYANGTGALVTFCGLPKLPPSLYSGLPQRTCRPQSNYGLNGEAVTALNNIKCR